MREKSRCWRRKQTTVERNWGVQNAVGEDGRQNIAEQVVVLMRIEEAADVDGVEGVAGRRKSRWTSDFPSGANVT